VIHGSFCHAILERILNKLVAIVIFNHFKLNLLVEGWYEVGSHRELLTVAQQTHVFQLGQRVALEHLQELRGHGASNLSLLISVRQNLVNTLL